MKIADAHTHIFPDAIAAKATRSIGSFYGFDGMYAPATAENLVKSCEGDGNTYVRLVCSSATSPSQVESINTFIAEECEKYSSFVGFGTLHPDYNDIEKETERIKSLGLRGIKFHHDFLQRPIDEPSDLRMYEIIAESGLPVLFHMGDNRYDFTAPSRLENLRRQVPGLITVAAHFGGYRRWKEALELTPSDTLLFDTSSSLAFIDKSFVESMLDRFGTDAFMYGTDFPMWNPEEELKRFFALKLSEKTEQKILFDNFNRLLPGEY